MGSLRLLTCNHMTLSYPHDRLFTAGRKLACCSSMLFINKRIIFSAATLQSQSRFCKRKRIKAYFNGLLIKNKKV